MSNFRDLEVFRLALGLMRAVYAETEAFPRHELYGLTAQMRRASVGVLSHVAEGEGRLTVGEWRHMLSEARGSLFEVEAQAIAARVLGYLPEAAYERIERRVRRVGSALIGLIRYVQNQERTKQSRNPVTPKPRDLSEAQQATSENQPAPPPPRPAPPP